MRTCAVLEHLVYQAKGSSAYHAHLINNDPLYVFQFIHHPLVPIRAFFGPIPRQHPPVLERHWEHTVICLPSYVVRGHTSRSQHHQPVSYPLFKCTYQMRLAAASSATHHAGVLWHRRVRCPVRPPFMVLHHFVKHSPLILVQCVEVHRHRCRPLRTRRHRPLPRLSFAKLGCSVVLLCPLHPPISIKLRFQDLVPAGIKFPFPLHLKHNVAWIRLWEILLPLR